jgi:hypothetical protein
MLPNNEHRIDRIVKDIRSDLTDFELMRKHNLSPEELRSILEELCKTGTLTKSSVYLRPIFYDDTMDPKANRRPPRQILTRLLSIYEAENPQNKGWLIDISETGFGVSGIDVEAGQTLDLKILPEDFSRAENISVTAECIWTRNLHPEAQPISGFKITNIADKDREELLKLIRMLVINDGLNYPNFDVEGI